eukprot:1097059-Prymnesium_polylepis.1
MWAFCRARGGKKARKNEGRNVGKQEAGRQEGREAGKYLLLDDKRPNAAAHDVACTRAGWAGRFEVVEDRLLFNIRGAQRRCGT